MFKRVGTYYYLFPTYNQGQKILWDGMDKEGFKFMSHFPREIIKHKDESAMQIETTNGSIFQIIGTDKIDSIVGTNPVGCVFSEYSLQNPKAWDFLRPILLENEGWAIFDYTPRGRNHGYDLYQMAKLNNDWYCELLTVNDTLDENGNRYISDKMIQEERDSGMEEDLIQQEYYCSFEAAVKGAYYSSQIEYAVKNNRFTSVPWIDGLEVDTFWDLGVNDQCSIWFVQYVGREIHMIDYYENSGEGLAYYAKVLKERGYNYRKHFLPHDAEAREISSGRPRIDTLKDSGMTNLEIVPKMSIQDGIEMARRIFSQCYFDKEKCLQGIRCLQEYHKEYDDKNKVYRNSPFHNWASNGADAFRMFGIANEHRILIKKTQREIYKESHTDDNFDKHKLIN